MNQVEYNGEYYGMFTDAGNAAVHSIVQGAISNDLSWLETYQCLVNLAENPDFAEATDTMVRELVYDELGCGGDFYITDEYDGQPDEAQEWHDFDPDC
jgi:hypothetical protein